MKHPTQYAEYFQKPEIEIGENDILAFTCLRNEAMRIPYFLKFYRDRGVSRFFVVDNGSNDGSGELLRNEPDVVYFYTEGSYGGSGSSREWTQELAYHYGRGHWCLTVDADEILVYPGWEQFDIPQFCAYLDDEDVQGLFCTFLDMYSDKTISRTAYTPPEPFQDVCPYYEIDSYKLHMGTLPPFMGISGGPRWRVFWDADPEMRGPAMRKVPLVKWDDTTRYIYSTHAHNSIRLSQLTGVLMHFKFMSFFQDVVDEETTRGDRRLDTDQNKDYRRYKDTLKKDPSFIGPWSHRFTHSSDFVRSGLMSVTENFRAFVTATRSGKKPVKDIIGTPDAIYPFDQKSQTFNISAISQIWQFVNPGQDVHDQLRKRFSRFRPWQRAVELERHIRVLDIKDDELFFQVNEEAWEVAEDLDVSLVLTRDWDKFSYRISMQELGENRTVERDTGSLNANVFRGKLPKGAGSATTSGSGNFSIDLVVGDPHLRRPQRRTLFSSDTLGNPEKRFRGTCTQLRRGFLEGWIFDGYKLSYATELAVYSNGSFLTLHTPARPWQSLDATAFNRKCKPDETRHVSGLGFAIPLPGRLFEDADTKLDVKVRFSSYHLNHSPVKGLTQDAKLSPLWNRIQSALRH